VASYHSPSKHSGGNYDENVKARRDWRVWLQIGALGFGGPAGQIALLQRELIEKRKWISHDELSRTIALTSIIPGPEAHQTATYIGLKRSGLKGALTAATLFIAPGAVITAALAGLYLAAGDLPVVRGALQGLQASVIAIIAAALISLGRRALVSKLLWLVAGASFIASFFLGIPFILVALALGTAAFAVRPEVAIHPETPTLQSVQLGRLIDKPKRVVAIGVSLLVLVAVCVLAINIWTGSDSRWGSLAWVLLVSAYTLGGAYAIVDYASQEFVINYGWLSATDMSVGLGLGESTPGPLILVLEFASILAAATDPFSLLPIWLAGALAGLLAVFVLFATSTGIILSIAPFTDRLLASARLRQAMRVISAAVVGVLVSLGLSFAITTFFGEVELTRFGDLVQVLTPTLDSIYWPTVLIGALAAVLLFRLRLPLWQVALISAGVGALVH